MGGHASQRLRELIEYFSQISVRKRTGPRDPPSSDELRFLREQLSIFPVERFDMFESTHLVRRKFLQHFQPGTEFLAPFRVERAHLPAPEDQVAFFIGVLGKEGVEHLVRRFLHRDIDGNDTPVQTVESLKADKCIGDDDNGKDNKRHVAK